LWVVFGHQIRSLTKQSIDAVDSELSFAINGRTASPPMPAKRSLLALILSQDITTEGSRSFLVIGHWSLVIGHWSLVIGHWAWGIDN
jgi:hypothetical protein